MENRYESLLAALEAAAPLLDDGIGLADGADTWEVDNLVEAVMDEPEAGPFDGDDGKGYYVVGFDGRIGITHDDGYSVRWLYWPKPLPKPQSKYQAQAAYQRRKGYTAVRVNLPGDYAERFRTALKATGRKQSDVLREAIDAVIAAVPPGLPYAMMDRQIGERMAIRREELGMVPSDVAMALRMPVEQYEMIERGEIKYGKLPVMAAKLIAVALGTTIEELID